MRNSSDINVIQASSRTPRPSKCRSSGWRARGTRSTSASPICERQLSFIYCSARNERKKLSICIVYYKFASVLSGNVKYRLPNLRLPNLLFIVPCVAKFGRGLLIFPSVSIDFIRAGNSGLSSFLTFSQNGNDVPVRFQQALNCEWKIVFRYEREFLDKINNYNIFSYFQCFHDFHWGFSEVDTVQQRAVGLRPTSSYRHHVILNWRVSIYNLSEAWPNSLETIRTRSMLGLEGDPPWPFSGGNNINNCNIDRTPNKSE